VLAETVRSSTYGSDVLEDAEADCRVTRALPKGGDLSEITEEVVAMSASLQGRAVLRGGNEDVFQY